MLRRGAISPELPGSTKRARGRGCAGFRVAIALPPSFMVEDQYGNELCGTFSADGPSISGNYVFGEFAPQGGIAVGNFPSAPP